ncbi:hypothetical protein ACFQ7B_42890 [Streptomyces erythrochromogenes]|uniref:hypothetical protein n=1 Tax=Streptomyces erythrochromogenes TaxID=285574 RepID=UPI0036754871
MVREVLPEREAGLRVGSCQWPLLATRMQQLGESTAFYTGAVHMNSLTSDPSWQEASGTALVGCLVDAALASLTIPPGASAASGPQVFPAAVRSCSPTPAVPGTRPWSPPTGNRPPGQGHWARLGRRCPRG